VHQQGSGRTRARKWCADVDLHRTRRRVKTCSHVHDYCSNVSDSAIACATRKCARDRIVAGRRRQPLVSSDGGPSPHETTARSELLVSSDGSSCAAPSVGLQSYVVAADLAAAPGPCLLSFFAVAAPGRWKGPEVYDLVTPELKNLTADEHDANIACCISRAVFFI
jgi:hypothetical protein